MCALGLAIANHQSTNMNVLQLVLSIGVFATGINAEATAPAGACLICGPGKVVTNSAGIFEFPGQPSMTCAALQALGLQGLLKPKECQKLPPLLSQCGCAAGDLAVPVPAPRVGPRAALVCPPIPTNGCSVCGAGKCITNSTALTSALPNVGQVPCIAIQAAGLNGQVSPAECPFVASFLDLCVCAQGDTPATPTSMPVPPAAAPTKAPEPTAAAPTPGPQPTAAAPTPGPRPIATTSTPTLATQESPNQRKSNLDYKTMI